MKYIDAHLHPEGLGYPGSEDADNLFICGTRPDDWDNVTEGKRFFGVHPWYASEWNSNVRERLISLLENDCSAGVGEIGLDCIRGDLDTQISVFIEQLSIASEMNRVVNIHCVKAEEHLLKIIRDVKPKIPMIIHSYSGSEGYVKSFTEYGCYFSISPRILSRSKSKTEKMLKSIPVDRILIETDAPYFPTDFVSMEKFTESLSLIMGINVTDLLSISLKNAERLL